LSGIGRVYDDVKLLYTSLYPIAGMRVSWPANKPRTPVGTEPLASPTASSRGATSLYARHGVGYFGTFSDDAQHAILCRACKVPRATVTLHYDRRRHMSGLFSVSTLFPNLHHGGVQRVREESPSSLVHLKCLGQLNPSQLLRY
jgi:hypothetical protein